MAINFDQNRAGLINLSRNINNNQMAFVPDFLKNIFTGNPEDIQIGEEGSPIDKAKDALEKNKQKELPSAEDVLKGNISSLDLPSNNLTAMAISNYDNLFGPQILTDALGNIRTTSGFTKPDINTAPFDVNKVSTDGITNNIRFRDMLLNDIKNLPSDIKTGLGESKNEFLEDISGVTQRLGSIKDKGIDLLGSGKELAFRGIGNLIAGPIGGFIGGALGKIKETPEQKAMRDFYKIQTGLDSIGRVQSGIMQGYNPVSMFGPQGLTSAIDKRLATILRTEQRKKKKGLELSQELIKRRKELEALKAREEAARVAATRDLAEQNRREGKGGYQAGYGSDFMGGSGTSKDMGSS